MQKSRYSKYLRTPCNWPENDWNSPENEDVNNFQKYPMPAGFSNLGGNDQRKILNQYADEFGFDSKSYGDWKKMSKTEKVEWVDELVDLIFY